MIIEVHFYQHRKKAISETFFSSKEEKKNQKTMISREL